eukprot:TRINITY_DN6771_c0_g3_i1.p1 TRINITY_DN6771_c0_g3~~TRINITY_DN6771_c0_g3_i1.p1  ORF type:complete len:195 (+),score=38.88 TRINITY_DN6771_c0_g3_i1:33-587(+)
MEFEERFGKAKVRVKVDDGKYNKPGWKFNYWELKGVPIRMELGKKDYENEEVLAVRRDTGEKLIVKWENLPKTITTLLEEMHENIFEKAKSELNGSIVDVNNWEDFMQNINKKKVCLAPWCGSPTCELNIQQKSKEGSRKDATAAIGAVKALNVPFNSSLAFNENKCFACGNPASCKPLWGRSY